MTMSRRELAKATLTMTAAAVAVRAGAAITSPSDGMGRDPLWFVNPELRFFARQMKAMEAQFPPFSLESLPLMRKGLGIPVKPRLASVPVVKKAIPGHRGAPDVVIYVINAKPGMHRPGILHTHGGGFVAGSAAADVPDMQSVAQAIDCTIVTVEYRLAPETRFVGSIEDNYAALLWLQANATDLGVDTRRLAVLGGSAGGGHAALLAIAARDRGEVSVAFQCLIYPMLDDRTGTSRKVPAPIGTVLWNASANHFGWRSFLGMEPGTSAVPVAAVPARVRDVAGLPPAFIGVGSIDLFVQEDIAYANRLIEAGIPTELVVVPGAFHGFDGIAAETSVAKQFTSAKIEALRRALRATA